MWEANKWWRLVEVGEITEEYPVMLPLSNPRPLHVHQPVFFMSSKTMHIFMLRSSPKVSLVISNFKKLNWGTTCTWVPWGRAAHHNAPEKILIHPLCVSLLTPDGFFVISTGFLEVPVGICSTHIGKRKTPSVVPSGYWVLPTLYWLAWNTIHTAEYCFGILPWSSLHCITRLFTDFSF